MSSKIFLKSTNKKKFKFFKNIYFENVTNTAVKLVYKKILRNCTLINRINPKQRGKFV